MPKVFISHSTHDRHFVENELIPALASRGIESWYSKQDIHGATEWAQRIVAGLEECDWFLVVMSRRAAESEWVRDEIHWAMDYRGGRIVPVLIDDCDPMKLHIRLRRIQYFDFSRDRGRAREELLRTWESEGRPASTGKPVVTEREEPPRIRESAGAVPPPLSEPKAAGGPTPERLGRIEKYRRYLIWACLSFLGSPLLALVVIPLAKFFIDLSDPNSPRSEQIWGAVTLLFFAPSLCFVLYAETRLSMSLYSPSRAVLFTILTLLGTLLGGYILIIPILIFASNSILRKNGGDLSLLGKRTIMNRDVGGPLPENASSTPPPEPAGSGSAPRPTSARRIIGGCLGFVGGIVLVYSGYTRMAGVPVGGDNNRVVSYVGFGLAILGTSIAASRSQKRAEPGAAPDQGRKAGPGR